MSRSSSTQRDSLEVLQRPGRGVGEPGPSGSPALSGKARLEVVTTLHQLIETLSEQPDRSPATNASPPRDLALLLDAAEAAKLLSLSRAKVFDMANHGEIPSIRLGRSVRIPRDALVAWVRERTSEPDLLQAHRLPHWARGDRSLER